MKTLRHIIIALMAASCILTIFSCANRGIGPQGGPKDVTPPLIMKYSPADGSVNMKTGHIELTFDEIVVLQNAYQKVIVSPPQHTPAEIKAVGKKVIVNFIDSLIDSTTYSIDFTDAIADNNEGNRLNGFTYSFSTGDHLDSLRISGRILNAESLNPTADIYVGIHPADNDSAFTTTPFRRIAKTDEKGYFTIRNIAPGSYRLFALDDIGSDFTYNMPGERIAYLDTILIPQCDTQVTTDTIHNDSTQTDSLITHTRTTYSPENLLLLSFAEPDIRQYLLKSQRQAEQRLDFYFNAPIDTLPHITPLNFPDTLFRPIVIPTPTRDTLTYWLTDTALWHQDTLRIALSYHKIDLDSSYNQTDTLTLVARRSKASASSKNKSRKNDTGIPGKTKTPQLITSNASATFDIYRPLTLTFAMPTQMIQTDSATYRLEQKQDTLWTPIRKARIIQTDSIGTQYTLTHDWQPETTYRLILDSALFRNMISQVSAPTTLNITTKSLEQYSRLILHLTNPRGNEVIQLLNDKDKPVREIALTDTTDSRTTTVSFRAGKTDITFDYITPGTYYLRLFYDDNNDRKWTPGSYSDRRQAETLYYFPFDIELRAFWDVEEDWDPASTPLQQQKPKELIQTDKKK